MNDSVLTKATVLVTGGLGAIGSALSRELLKKDITFLLLIDDHSSSYPELVKDILSDKRVKHFADSVVNNDCLASAFSKKPTVIFHLAANFANQNSVDNPIKDTEVNSLGTIKVLDYAQKSGVQKFIYASSSCVYGDKTMQPADAQPVGLDTPYAINKLHGEFLTNFFHEYHSMNTVVLRYFNSFGPGELPGKYRNVVPNFFARAMRGLNLQITGGEHISRDFNYIENTVTATLLAAESERSSGQTYNVGSGYETKIVDLAKMINEICGNTTDITIHPSRSWDSIPNRCAHIEKTEKELGYKPVIDTRAQLEKTYEWLQRYAHLFPKEL